MSEVKISRRQVLLALPALALAPKAWPQSAAAAPIPVRSFNHFMLSVTDVPRSVAFYQGLFGMPIQARQGSTVLLRVGAGPQYLGLAPAGANPPGFSHFGLAVDGFDADRVMRALADHGVARAAAGDPGPAGGPMKARVTGRDGTPEIFLGDPDGLVVQLQDASYCGGSGPLGAACRAVEAPPKPGVLASVDMSHATIQVGDAQRTAEFYRTVFGVHVQGHQAPPGSDASPFYGIGRGPQFLMFTGGGAAAGRGAAVPSRSPRIDHICLSMKGFDPETVTKALNGYGIKSQEQGAPRGPLMTYISLRMPNRGGAPEGTPELYFLDPDGLSIQIQDATYCGGSGFLGNSCSG